MKDKKEHYAHLGDGVYVYYNGHAFELKVNDHRNPTVAVLGTAEVENLKDFKDRMLSKNFTAEKRAERKP